MENKVVTASPNGNFMIFDVGRGKFGKSALASLGVTELLLTYQQIERSSEVILDL